MNKLALLLCIVLLAVDTARGGEHAAVATVGKRDITVEEFTQRFELTPWNKDIRSVPVETSKQEFLYTLIAEKLWALKAVELGLDTSIQVREHFRSLEKMLVRDALYQREIIENVTHVQPNGHRETDVRLAEEYYRAFMRGFFKDKSTDINGKLYQSIVSKLIPIIQSKRGALQPGDTSAVYLDARDFTNVKRSLGADTMHMELLRYKDQYSTLIDFLEFLHYDENAFKRSDTATLKRLLSAKLRTFMQAEYLAWEGYARGLALLPEVVSQLRIWKDNYLSLALRGTFRDSLQITDEEVQEYYSKKANAQYAAQVNIVEVLTDHLDVIERVLHDYGTGTDFHELAERYSKREMTKATRGEFGYFPVTSFGDIGAAASRLSVGQVGGPIKTEEGYSVFKVLGRKEAGMQQVRAFDEMKGELRNTLLGMKNYHGLVRYTVKLAREYGISIDQRALDAIDVTTVFSVTYRYFGFGGRILGAPLIAPNTEWVAPWKASGNDNL